MKKEYTIYDISTGEGVPVLNVKNKTTARFICYEHNKNGERNYMYLERVYDD